MKWSVEYKDSSGVYHQVASNSMDDLINLLTVIYNCNGVIVLVKGFYDDEYE